MAKQLVRVQIPGNYKPDEDYQGLEAAVINIERSLKGVQVGLLNITEKTSYGAQLGIINGSGEFLGFNLGVFNLQDCFKGFSFGVLNDYKESTGFKIGGVNGNLSFSSSDEYSSGLDVAIINRAQDEYGLQLGLWNVVKSELNGVQIGIICEADEGKYLQLGLITHRINRDKWYKSFSPFIGFGNKSGNSKKHKE